MSRREERLAPLPPDDGSERLRRLERLSLVNGGIFLAGLVCFVLSLPLSLSLSPFRLSMLSVLAVCAGAGLWLRRRFRTALDEELRRRKEAAQEARAADQAKGQRIPTAIPAVAESAAEVLRQARRERRILVVDDQPVNRSITLAWLQQLGYDAEAVESGEKALALLAERPCAAVLLDLEMPGLDGFETLRRLRRQEAAGGRTPPAPVIALTAHTSEEEREKCFAAGMDGFLSKPFGTAELAAVLDLWTEIEAPAAASIEERLAALKALGGEAGEAVLAEVVEAFLLQGKRDLAAMQHALPQGDGETLAAAAHALAGSSALLGAADLARSAVELARLARQGELGACTPWLAEVEQEYRAVAGKLAPG